MGLSIKAEFQANHLQFNSAVQAQTTVVHQALSGENSTFLESYKLICAFRGWHEIALRGLSEEVIGFFIEAHNDLLTSHVLAMNGMWRSALMALRSFMESYLSFVYFLDHSVELRLWEEGTFRLEPKNLRQYCVKHPVVCGFPVALAAARKLESQYKKLSGSVHGSRTDFRMTAPSAYPAIAYADVSRLKKWLALEREVVRSALLILLALNSSALKGAAFPVFRTVLGAVMTEAAKKAAKQQMKVTI